MIIPFVVGRLPWESDEAVFVKRIKRMAESLYRYTELEMDDLTEVELRALLKNCSTDLDKMVGDLDNKVEELIDRDTQPHAGKVCSGCSDKLYICNKCYDEIYNTSRAS